MDGINTGWEDCYPPSYTAFLKRDGIASCDEMISVTPF